jgi:hypothetical protein
LSTSNGGPLREAFPGEDVSVLDDYLLEGPVESLSQHADLGSWLDARRDWWRTHYRRESHPPRAPGSPELVERLDRLDSYDEAVVWTADSSPEQLFACWAAAVVDRWNLDEESLRIAYLGTTGRMRTMYPGLLYPSQLAETDTRRWTAAEFATGCRVWDAFADSSPRAFVESIGEAAEHEIFSALPWIIERFPDASTGLDGWERRLLERLREGRHVTAYHIAHVLEVSLELERRDATGDYVGDGILFERLLELSYPHNENRLVRRWGTGDSMINTYFDLTDKGRAVLDGQANRIDLMGLDRWLGGTHLDSRTGAVWCRDGERLLERACPDAPDDVAYPVVSRIPELDEEPGDPLIVSIGQGYRVVSSVHPETMIWHVPDIPDTQPVVVSSMDALADLSDVPGRDERRYAAWKNVRSVSQMGVDALVERCMAAETVVVWVGKSIRESLMLGAVIASVRAADEESAECIEVREPTGLADGQGLGRVHPVVLDKPAGLVDPASLRELESVWEAFTASTPALLNELIEEGLESERARAVLDYVVGLFPDASTGLTREEQAALRELEERGRPLMENPWVDRVYAEGFDEATALVTRQRPKPGRPYVFPLTDLGQRVLAGEENHVEVSGIDRYVGGMHLSSEEGKVWWRKDGRLVERRGED